MTAFQSSRNFGFDNDMEMDFTEHSQKRGEALNFLEIKLSETLNYAIKSSSFTLALLKTDTRKSVFVRKKVIDRHFSSASPPLGTRPSHAIEFFSAT